jgi:hypothetical protein
MQVRIAAASNVDPKSSVSAETVELERSRILDI